MTSLRAEMAIYIKRFTAIKLGQRLGGWKKKLNQIFGKVYATPPIHILIQKYYAKSYKIMKRNYAILRLFLKKSKLLKVYNFPKSQL